MDRRNVRLQIDLLRVTYRGEARRLSPAGLDAFRQRAFAILDQLTEDTADLDGVSDQIEAARREISGQASD